MKKHPSRILSRIIQSFILFCLITLLTVGCGGGGGGAPSPTPTGTTLNSTLTGGQEVPPNASTASGIGTCRLAPPVGDVPATTRPLCETMIFCTSARPRPVPLRFEVKNG